MKFADLGAVSRPPVSQGVFNVINGVQTLRRPNERVVAIAACLLLIGREHGLDVPEVLRVADRVLFDAERNVRPELAAAQQYVRNEL